MCLLLFRWKRGGRAVASGAMWANEYLIHLDYLLVWFNMACIMKHDAATSKMRSDSTSREAACTCRPSASIQQQLAEWMPPPPPASFHLCLSAISSALRHHFNWASIFPTMPQKQGSDGDALWEWGISVRHTGSDNRSNGYRQCCHPARVHVIGFTLLSMH